MQFLVESNPVFLIIKKEEDQYVFYNSLQHRASRLNYLEMVILDMYYTYQNKDYILSKFSDDKREILQRALNAIDKHKLLLCEEIQDTESHLPEYPSMYYLHLTYNCNLKCTYCYNKNIRKGKNAVLNLCEWEAIIDKIAPYAKGVILTGGECFLFPHLTELLSYIKKNYPYINITAISNGMHDFKNGEYSKVFEYITSITLSCDSISREGERKGFNPTLYKNNVVWLKTHFPNLNITIASTITSSNSDDIQEITHFCDDLHCGLSKTILIPETADNLRLMHSIDDQIQSTESTNAMNPLSRLKPAAFRCEAGKSVCSIDPMGNMYPCQSLHYDEFMMGNILYDDIKDLSYFGKEGFILKTVNDFAVCSKCNVKYLCGGGCPATAYKIYNGKLGPNHLTCKINYLNCIEKLKSLDNRL